MAAPDRLGTDLAALRNTLPVNPPGVEAAFRTVARRRRRRLIGTTVTAIVLLVAVATVAFSMGTTPHRPDVPPTPSPAPAGATGSARAGNGRGNQVPTTCRSNGLGGLNGHDNYLADVDLMVYPEQLCPNQQVEAAWATYSVDAGGVQHLYRSQRVVLD